MRETSCILSNAGTLNLTTLGCDGSVLVFDAFGVEGRWFESHSSRRLGKSFTCSCLYDVMWCPAWLPWPTWRLERDSNPRPFWTKGDESTNEPPCPELSQSHMHFPIATVT